MLCKPPRSTRDIARLLVPAWLSLTLLAVPLHAWADETPEERAARLARMPAEEKQELLRKKERFDKLLADEQRRLRELHHSISSAENAPQLQGTLSRYSQWLRSLSSAERAELLVLPCDERIAKIKEIVRRQEAQRFRQFAGSDLPDQDKDIIYEWLKEFVAKHEDEIVSALSPDFRRRLSPDPERRRKSLIFWFGFRRPGGEAPYTTRDDFALLLPKLSEATRRELEKIPPEEKENAASELVRATVYSKMMPQVKEEDLKEFFSKLTPTERARLDSQNPDQMKRELTRMYHSSQFRNRDGRPPGDGPHFGPSGDNPRFGPRGSGPPRGNGDRRGPSDGKGRSENRTDGRNEDRDPPNR